MQAELCACAGVEDDGFPRGLIEADLEQSLTTLKAMAAEVHATCTHLRSLPGSSGRACAVLRMHRICRNEVSYVDLRIAGEAPSMRPLHAPCLWHWLQFSCGVRQLYGHVD